ncbi:MAG: efflux RND transporter periplasmic adaptor subunit [Chthoniobacterales bacterium]|nr:efflux RND transporter periplasmic adaptor subunit [Chthoniobacterales bacterium]
MTLPKRTRRIILGFSTLLLLVAFAFLATQRIAQSARERRRAELERAQLVPPPPAQITARRSSLTRSLSYPAELEPYTTADIPAEVAGKILTVNVDVGASVEAGQPLAQIESTLASIAAQRARARRDEANRLLAEYRRLLESRAISQSQYEAQASTTKIEEAALQEAEEILNRHTIRAPFAGKIQARYTNPGNAIAPNQPVFRLLDLSKLRAIFFVPENEISSLHIGKLITLWLNSNPDKKFQFHVSRISPSADQRTRLFRVEGDLPNTDNLPAGIPATVSFDAQLYENTIFLPTNALRFENGKAYVLRLSPSNPSSSEKTEVIIGKEVSGLYPILAGLEEGETILLP